MPHTVRLQDGSTATFPDSMTPDQIAGALRQHDYQMQLKNRPGVPAPPNPIQKEIDSEKGAINLDPMQEGTAFASFRNETGKQIKSLGQGVLKTVKELPGRIENPFNHPLAITEVGNVLEQARQASPSSYLGRLPALADIVMGGNPAEGVKNWQSGDKGAALADFLSVPALTIAASKMLPEITTESPEILTPGNRSSLANIMAQGGMNDQYLMQRGGAVDRMLPYLRMAAKENGLTTDKLAEAFPHREMEPLHPISSIKESLKNHRTGDFRVDRGVQARNQLFDTTEQLFDRQFETLVGEYKSVPMDTEQIANNIIGNIKEAEATVSPALEKKLLDTAKGTAGYSQKTLAGLDQLRIEFGNAANKAYKAVERGTVSESDLQAADAYRRAADMIRNAEYDKLSEVSTIPKDQIQQLQRLHGDAVEMKIANRNATLGVQKEQAGHETEGLRRVLLGRSGERTVYGKGVASRLFKAGPQGELNLMARRALRGLEQGGEPQRILPSMRDVKQLPQPGPPAPVSLPTEVTQLLQSGKTGGLFPARDVLPEGRGTQLPSLDSRLPEGHRYARERVPYKGTDYVGSGRFNIPAEDAEGVFPGQYSELPALGKSELRGTEAGTMQISTPEQARKTLESLSSADFSKLDAATQAQVRQTIEDLQRLASYQKLPTGPPIRKMTVVPEKKGVYRSTRPRVLPRLGYHAGIAAASANREEQ